MSETITSLTDVSVDFYLYKRADISKARPEPGADDIASEFIRDNYLMHPDLLDIQGVFVTGATYRTVVNGISEASVSLGLKGTMERSGVEGTKNIEGPVGEVQSQKTGLDFLNEIFPVDGKPAHQYIGEIIVRGNRTSTHTAIPMDVNAFRGQVQGYGLSASSSTYVFDITLKGFFFNLQQITLATPGMHGDVPHSLGVAQMVWHQDDAGEDQNQTDLVYFTKFIAQTIIGNIEVIDGFDLFMHLVHRYIKIVNTEFIPNIEFGGRIRRIYDNSLRAFGLITDTRRALFDGPLSESIFGQAVTEELASQAYQQIGGSEWVFAGRNVSGYLTNAVKRPATEPEYNPIHTPFECLHNIVYHQDGISLNRDFDLKGELFQHILLHYLASPHESFWNYFMSLLEVFGLAFIDFGFGGTITVKNPIMSGEFTSADFIPGEPAADEEGEITNDQKMNYIRSEDIVDLKIFDTPSVYPTRVFVSTMGEEDYTGLEALNTWYTYPDEHDEDITQEELTLLIEEERRGPSFLFYQAPAFLQSLLARVKVPDATIEAMKADCVFKNPTLDQEGSKIEEINAKNVDTERTERYKRLAKTYAKYIYMTEKHRQRTGAVITRYMPNIAPGLTLRIEDPTRNMLIECYPLDVTHNLDANSGIATTTIAFTHVRYSGEIKPYPFEHPIYPKYNPAITAQIIYNITNCADPWEVTRKGIRPESVVELLGDDNSSWNAVSGGKYTRKSILPTQADAAPPESLTGAIGGTI